MNLLSLLALFLPFQFALNLASGFDVSVLRVIILFFFAGVILKSLYEKNFFIPLNLQSVCLLGFFLINVFSLFFAKNLELGLRKILFLASIFPLYFVMVVFWSTEVQPRAPQRLNLVALVFVKYFILGGFLSSIVALIVFFSQFIVGIDGILDFYGKIGPFFWGKYFAESVFEYQSFLVNIGETDFFRASGLFPDPHNFALYAGMILFLALPLALARHKAKNFYMAVFLIGAISLLLSFARGAYVAFIAAGLFLGFLLLLKSNKLTNNKSAILPAIFTAIIILFLIVSPVRNRFLDIFSAEEGSNAGRIEAMTRGIDIFKDNFLFGVGAGNVSIYYNEDVEGRNLINSHSTYLEIAIESGILGLAAYVALIFGTILQLIKQFYRQKDEFLQYLTLGIASALMFFSVYGVFEFLYSPINLAALMILLALSSVIAKLSSRT